MTDKSEKTEGSRPLNFIEEIVEREIRDNINNGSYNFV